MVIKKSQIIDGNTICITDVGDINSNFLDVFVSLDIASDLLFVFQLVVKKYNINFFHVRCIIHKQVSRMVIVKRPKVGGIFPLQFTYNHLSLASKLYHFLLFI